MNSNLQQPHISLRHRTPLESAIAGSAPGRSYLAADLYKVALAELNGQHQEERNGILLASITQIDSVSDTLVRVATATDDETGYFVQLTGVVTGYAKETRPEGAALTFKDGPLLIFGKKFVQELKPSQLHNTAVRLWK